MTVILSIWGIVISLSKRWHTETKLRFLSSQDWSGKDPDAIQDGTETKNKTVTVGLTHNGRISVDKLFMRSLNYTLGLSYGETNNVQTAFVPVSTGLLPILTSKETGYFNVPWKTQSYKATGRTESRQVICLQRLMILSISKPVRRVRTLKLVRNTAMIGTVERVIITIMICYHYNQTAMVVLVLSMMCRAYIR